MLPLFLKNDIIINENSKELAFNQLIHMVKQWLVALFNNQKIVQILQEKNIQHLDDYNTKKGKDAKSINVIDCQSPKKKADVTVSIDVAILLEAQRTEKNITIKKSNEVNTFNQNDILQIILRNQDCIS